MNVSDWIALGNVITTGAAVVAAPIIALRVSARLQARTNRRQEQLDLLAVLVSLRHTPLLPESFRALNSIDVAFVNAPAVREAWSKYFLALNDSSLNSGSGFSIREEKRRDLMVAMIEHLGLRSQISTTDLIRTYIPNSTVETEYLAIWERIKRRVDLRAEFIARGIGFPDFAPPYYPPVPPQGVPQSASSPGFRSRGTESIRIKLMCGLRQHPSG